MNRANKHRSLPALFAICVALLSLTGCIGGSSPAIKFYVLNPVNAQSQDDSEASPLHIEITAVRLPQYLERPQIVTRTGDNRLLLSEFNQWGGNLRKNMTRTLAVNLSRQLDTPNIAIAPYRGATQPDFRVEIEIIKFEKDSDNKVRLSAHWRLTDGKSGKIAAIQITDLESDHLPTAGTYGDTVTTMAAMYGRLGKIIADTIIQLKGNTAA